MIGSAAVVIVLVTGQGWLLGEQIAEEEATVIGIQGDGGCVYCSGTN